MFIIRPGMNFPLKLRFKILALAPQVYVQDANGQTLCYVKQKLLRLKEKVEVYSDDTCKQLIATIEADRIIDWSAKYTFRDASGREIGALGRKGMKSLWRAHYEVYAPGSTTAAYTIREENPMAKFFDGLLSQIPLVGLASGYMLHPKYLTTRADGTPVMRLTKQPAFLEGLFDITQLAPLAPEDETSIVLGYLMMNLLERARG